MRHVTASPRRVATRSTSIPWRKPSRYSPAAGTADAWAQPSLRGEAVCDWLHVAAARKAGAESLITLDLRDFQSMARPGDPRIQMP